MKKNIYKYKLDEIQEIEIEEIYLDHACNLLSLWNTCSETSFNNGFINSVVKPLSLYEKWWEFLGLDYKK